MKEKYIKLTKKVIENYFDESNKLYFNNEVVKPKRFEVWTPHRKILGLTRGLYNKQTEKYSAALHISKCYNWTEDNLKKVIIHEMIHLLICDYMTPLRWWERIFPFLIVQHDNEFKEYMNYLNKNYNLDIKIKFPEMKNYFKK